MKTPFWLHHARRVVRILLSSLLLMATAFPGSQPAIAAESEPNLTISAVPNGRFPQFELLDPTPFPGDQFGSRLLVLRTGNVLVADPYDDFAAPDAGAVQHFDGLTGALISTLTGTHAHDLVGIGGMVELNNGNFVVFRPNWSNGATPSVGAVTWGNGRTGVTGVVSPANSLVGSHSGDIDFRQSRLILNNDSYLVLNPLWDNGSAVDAGSVTWANGATGVTGEISATNSLVGAQANDRVGFDGLTLNNGNYVVSSPNWANGALPNAGAVTWANGATGVTGPISAANSLVGSQKADNVGLLTVALSNGNYVVGCNLGQWGYG